MEIYHYIGLYVNFGSIYITKGTQIRIPQNLNEILASYNEINNI
mgnify:CR=1 FL=1